MLHFCYSSTIACWAWSQILCWGYTCVFASPFGDSLKGVEGEATAVEGEATCPAMWWATGFHYQVAKKQWPVASWILELVATSCYHAASMPQLLYSIKLWTNFPKHICVSVSFLALAPSCLGLQYQVRFGSQFKQLKPVFSPHLVIVFNLGGERERDMIFILGCLFHFKTNNMVEAVSADETIGGKEFCVPDPQFCSLK